MVWLHFSTCLVLNPDEEWWDGSAEAGEKTRPGGRFAEPAPSLEILSRDGSAVKSLDLVSPNINLDCL